MTRPLPLALVQAPAHPANDTASFGATLERLTRTHPQARLFVHPELHLCGGSEEGSEDDGMDEDEEAIAATAEPIDGPRDRMLAGIAGDLGVWLAPGSVYERAADGRIHNTAPVYSPAGHRVAAYRKVFPWRPYERIAPGAEFVVFDMAGFGRVGLSICYDAWFPEHTRHLAWMGAELVLNLVRTPTADRAQETVLARANAIVNQVFVASLNAAPPQGVGRSLLTDPEGRVRVESGGEPHTVLTDVVDLDAVHTVRTHGTAGLTRPWQQYAASDAPLELPLYEGRMGPERWGADPAAPAAPATQRGAGEAGATAP